MEDSISLAEKNISSMEDSINLAEENISSMDSISLAEENISSMEDSINLAEENIISMEDSNVLALRREKIGSVEGKNWKCWGKYKTRLYITMEDYTVYSINMQWMTKAHRGKRLA